MKIISTSNHFQVPSDFLRKVSIIHVTSWIKNLSPLLNHVESFSISTFFTESGKGERGAPLFLFTTTISSRTFRH